MEFRFRMVLQIVFFALLISSCQKVKKYPIGVNFDPLVVSLGDNGDHWISEDGLTMQLVFSDAANRHSTFYKWNMQEVRLKMSGAQEQRFIA